MPGCGTTNTIFILRQLLEKYFAKKKNLYVAFVDLEKAFFLSLAGCYMMGFEETRNRRVVGSSCTIDV